MTLPIVPVPKAPAGSLRAKRPGCTPMNPCVVCGRNVRCAPSARWVHLDIDGQMNDPAAPIPEQYDLGWHAVGPECAKRPDMVGYAVPLPFPLTGGAS